MRVTVTSEHGDVGLFCSFILFLFTFFLFIFWFRTDGRLSWLLLTVERTLTKLASRVVLYRTTKYFTSLHEQRSLQRSLRCRRRLFLFRCCCCCCNLLLPGRRAALTTRLGAVTRALRLSSRRRPLVCSPTCTCSSSFSSSLDWSGPGRPARRRSVRRRWQSSACRRPRWAARRTSARGGPGPSGRAAITTSRDPARRPPASCSRRPATSTPLRRPGGSAWRHGQCAAALPCTKNTTRRRDCGVADGGCGDL